MFPRNAATAPVNAAPSMLSRNAASARTGSSSRDGGASTQKVATDSAAVISSMAAVSHGRLRRTWDCALQSRMGEATTRTPSASPDDHVTAVPSQCAPELIALALPPIRPPTNGPATQAPTRKAMKSWRLLKSGRPPHQASTIDAPTTGSTTLDTANATDRPTGFP